MSDLADPDIIKHILLQEMSEQQTAEVSATGDNKDGDKVAAAAEKESNCDIWCSSYAKQVWFAFIIDSNNYQTNLCFLFSFVCNILEEENKFDEFLSESFPQFQNVGQT